MGIGITNNNHVDAIAGINMSTSQKPQTESNYLSAEDDLECKVCERNCGKGFYTTHRLDHTAKSAARTGSSEEKLEKHKDYKINQKLKNYLKIDALAGVDDKQQLLHIPPETDNTIKAKNLKNCTMNVRWLTGDLTQVGRLGNTL